jgi:Protein of unknown function (DUF3048) N-terminal domain/Protein of unknown function (DUF3048) C-terminal domain
VRWRGAVAATAAASLLVLAACGGGGHKAPVVAPTTTTDAPTTSTTSTTVPSGPPFPLTGLPSDGSANALRPALSIKIDNAPSARPQIGLQQADIVTEELVEGGLTRFLATYQSQDAASIGPVRSARPVDADLLNQLGGGIFAYSGAAAGEIAPVKARSGAVLLDAGAWPQAFKRNTARPAPSNLFTSTAALYQIGTRPGMAPPPSLFTYSTTAPTGAPASGITLRFSGTSVVGWRALTSGAYQRVENGIPAIGGDGAAITADNVVILSVQIGHTGIYDTAGNEDPLVIVTGSGPAWVLRDGVLEKGAWSRPDYHTEMTLTAADGTPMALKPGRTWVELLPVPATPVIG